MSDILPTVSPTVDETTGLTATTGIGPAIGIPVAETFFIRLEDASGNILLEDGTGQIQQEAA